MRPSEVPIISETPAFPAMGVNGNRTGTTQTASPKPRHTWPRPGRRRKSSYMHRFNFLHSLALSLFVLLSLCCSIHAADARPRASRIKRVRDYVVRENVLFDDRSAPQPVVHRRVQASSIPAPTETDTAIRSSASTSTSSGSTPTFIERAPNDSSSTLPTPFDGGLGTNYTQPSCPIFLKNMINNNTFIPCLPFSLLLQNSMSFFSITKSFSSISETLNTSCNVNFQACSNIMSSYAQTLRSSSACKQDYERQQPLVRQAHAGLLSYDVLYKASCTKTQTSAEQSKANYCFANAVTNMSSPTDSYVYYLPLGVPLPASSLPTCDGCLKDVMGIFAATASNKSQPLSLNYMNAAQQVNRACGPNFSNGTIPNIGASGSAQTSSASPQVYRLGWGLLAAMFLLATSFEL